MTCKELIDVLDDYVAANVSGPQLALFERHLAVCPSCVEYLRSYRDTIHLARGTTTPAPEDLPPELLALLLTTAARNTNH